MRARKRAAGALAALALAAGACGGDDGGGSDAFKEDYRAESAKVERIGTDIAAAVTRAPRTSDVDLARQFGDLAERAEGSVAAMRKLDPPDDLADERNELAAALDRGAEDLRDIATAANAGSPS